MMEKIKEAWARVAQEEKEEEERRLKLQLKIEKAREEKKKKEEAKLRAEEERRQRMLKKTTAERKWEMSKWIHKYIEENTLRWERERKIRKEHPEASAEELESRQLHLLTKKK